MSLSTIKAMCLGTRRTFFGTDDLLDTSTVLRVDRVEILEDVRRFDYTVTHRNETITFSVNWRDNGGSYTLIGGSPNDILFAHWPHLFHPMDSLRATVYAWALLQLAFAIRKGNGPVLPVDIDFDNASKLALRQLPARELPAAIPGRAEKS